MRTLYKEKGPRIRYEVAHRGPVIRASDRPIIPSALLTKNIMPISGRSFQTFALRVCPCLWHIFFFLLLVAPSIPSPPFISVPSLPPALPRPSQDDIRRLSRFVLPLCYPLLPAFADLYSRCVATRGATGTRVQHECYPPPIPISLARRCTSGRTLRGYGKWKVNSKWTDFVWNDNSSNLSCIHFFYIVFICNSYSAKSCLLSLN